MKSTKIFAVANQKGGVGKTTTCVNLAAAFVESGLKVLLLDNDPQANLTSYLKKTVTAKNDQTENLAPEKSISEKSTLDELYLEKRPPSLTDIKTRYLLSYQVSFDYIASDAALAGVEHYLFSRSDRETVLKKNLAWAVGEYDFILIDNPPTINMLTLNALTAAHGVLVPVQTEFFSLEGITKMQDTIAMVRERWNPELRVAGIVATQVDTRKKLTHEILSTLTEKFPTAFLSTRIRENSKLAESSGCGKTIFKYAPSSAGAEDYRNLSEELARVTL